MALPNPCKILEAIRAIAEFDNAQRKDETVNMKMP
jgi:hypothetical protein